MQDIDDDEVFFMEMEPNPFTITFSNSSPRQAYYEGPSSSRPSHSPLHSISSTADSGISMMRHRSSYSFSDSDAGSAVRTRASSASSATESYRHTPPDPLNPRPTIATADRPCQQRRRASWPSPSLLHCLPDEDEEQRRTDIGTQTSVESIVEDPEAADDYDDVFPAVSPMPGPFAASGPLPDIVQPWERTGAIPRRRVVSHPPPAPPRTPRRNVFAGFLDWMADEVDQGLNLPIAGQQQQGQRMPEAVAVQVRTGIVNFRMLVTPVGVSFAHWLVQWCLAKIFGRKP